MLGIYEEILYTFNMDNEQEKLMLEAKLAVLVEEHRALDSKVESMLTGQVCDMFALQRFKKRKLVLKDDIQKIKNLLTPDILA